VRAHRFCYYAAISISVAWLLEVTLFLACFTYTERRIAAGRYDLLCCVRRGHRGAPAALPARADDKLAPCEDTYDGTHWTHVQTAKASPPLPQQADRGAHAVAAAEDGAAHVVRAGGHRLCAMHSLKTSVEVLKCRRWSAARRCHCHNRRPNSTPPPHRPLDFKPRHIWAATSVASTRAWLQGLPKRTTSVERSAASAASPSPRKPRMSLMSASKDSWIQMILARYWLPVLFHPVTRAFVILLAIAGVVAGGVGAANVGEGLKLKDLAPDDSYVKSFDPLDVHFQSRSL
jgi:Sterol-sensing domain of SREBP cleavage-activation